MQRDDDKEETVRKRLQIYHAQTEPLVEYYAKLASGGGKDAPRYVKTNGIGSVEGIREQILSSLNPALAFIPARLPKI